MFSSLFARDASLLVIYNYKGFTRGRWARSRDVSWLLQLYICSPRNASYIGWHSGHFASLHLLP